MGVKAKSMAGW